MGLEDCDRERSNERGKRGTAVIKKRKKVIDEHIISSSPSSPPTADNLLSSLSLFLSLVTSGSCRERVFFSSFLLSVFRHTNSTDDTPAAPTYQGCQDLKLEHISFLFLFFEQVIIPSTSLIGPFLFVLTSNRNFLFSRGNLEVQKVSLISEMLLIRLINISETIRNVFMKKEKR